MQRRRRHCPGQGLIGQLLTTRHAEPVTIVFGATDDEVEGRPPLLAAFSLARAVIGDIEDGHCCCTETHNRNLFKPKQC